MKETRRKLPETMNLKNFVTLTFQELNYFEGEFQHKATERLNYIFEIQIVFQDLRLNTVLCGNRRTLNTASVCI